jgi:hypothetical protein
VSGYFKVRMPSGALYPRRFETRAEAQAMCDSLPPAYTVAAFDKHQKLV